MTHCLVVRTWSLDSLCVFVVMKWTGQQLLLSGSTVVIESNYSGNKANPQKLSQVGAVPTVRGWLMKLAEVVGAICLCWSLTCLISLAQRGQDPAKANWRHDYPSPIWSSALICVLSFFRAVALGVNRFLWCRDTTSLFPGSVCDSCDTSVFCEQHKRLATRLHLSGQQLGAQETKPLSDGSFLTVPRE